MNLEKLREEAMQVRRNGMERAAAIWETIASLPEAVAPASIYKAACSMKAAEFVARTGNHPLAPELAGIIGRFLDSTIDVLGPDEGTMLESARVLRVFEEEMPMTDEIFSDPVSYATRQHAYEGVLLLAASKLGKEEETKRCLSDLHDGTAKLLVKSIFGGVVLGFDPSKPGFQN